MRPIGRSIIIDYFPLQVRCFKIYIKICISGVILYISYTLADSQFRIFRKKERLRYAVIIMRKEVCFLWTGPGEMERISLASIKYKNLAKDRRFEATGSIERGITFK